MAIDSNHALFDILRRRGVEVNNESNDTVQRPTENIEDERHYDNLETNNQGTQTTQQKEEEVEEVYFEPPKEFDEILDYLEVKWDTYRTVEPSRKASDKVTRSELLNLAMKSGFRGRSTELLGSVIDIRERDIIANKSFEGLGLESVKISMEDLSNASKEYVHSKGVTDVNTKLIEYNNLRFVPEVFKIDKNENTIEVGYNKVFKFTTYCQSKGLPEMTVNQPKLVVKCYLTEGFSRVLKVEMNTNTVDRLDFGGVFSKPLKTYDDLDLSFGQLKGFIESKRDITTTDIIKVTTEDIKTILTSKSMGGRI